jgi:hypothetical protein
MLQCLHISSTVGPYPSFSLLVLLRIILHVTLSITVMLQIVLVSVSHVKLLPLPHPHVRARTDARTNPSAQRATQLRSVLARVYAVYRQNQITTTVP